SSSWCAMATTWARSTASSGHGHGRRSSRCRCGWVCRPIRTRPPSFSPASGRAVESTGGRNRRARRRSGALAPAFLLVQPAADERPVPFTIETGVMTAMNDADGNVVQPLHAGNVVVEVGVIGILDQRPVVEDVAREQDAGRLFPQ